MTALPIPDFALLISGNTEKEAKLAALYHKLEKYESKLILVEERYTETREIPRMTEVEFKYVRISLGTIYAPYLKASAPALYPLSARVSDGQGDLEIITKKNASLIGHWHERGTHFFLEEDKKATQIAIPSKMYLETLPMTEFMRLSGCTAIASALSITAQACALYLDQEVDRFFSRQAMVMEEDDKIIKRDSAGVYEFLKQKLQ